MSLTWGCYEHKYTQRIQAYDICNRSIMLANYKLKVYHPFKQNVQSVHVHQKWKALFLC